MLFRHTSHHIHCAWDAHTTRRTAFNIGSLDAQKDGALEHLPPLRMVERHYLHDTLLRGYDFTYGPVDAPSINNQWEFTYDLPPLTTAQGLSFPTSCRAMSSRCHLRC